MKRKLVLTLLALCSMAVVALFLKPRVIEHLCIRQLDSDDRAVRMTAARKLGELRSAKAVPTLTEVFQRDGDERREKTEGILHYSAQALVRIGAPSVPYLVQTLETNDIAKIRDGAIIALSDIGIASPRVVQALIKHARTNVRALFSLEDFGRAIVPQLIALLRDEERRDIAAHVLSKMGEPALTPVLRSMQGGDRESLLGALVAFKEIGRNSPERVVSEMISLLSADRGHRIVAGAVLGELGTSATKAVPHLETLVDSDDPGVKRIATEALQKIRGTAEDPK